MKKLLKFEDFVNENKLNESNKINEGYSYNGRKFNFDNDLRVKFPYYKRDSTNDVSAEQLYTNIDIITNKVKI